MDPAPDVSARAEAPPPLPPVPRATGPLAIRVQYPSANAVIAARDSNFIFGTVGHGDATLTINGMPVPVLANGAFLAYLPLPPASAPRYAIVASAGGQTARSEHPVRLQPPRPDLAEAGPLVVDSASLSPGEYTLRPSAERLRVSIRAPRNASVWLEWEAGRRAGLMNAAVAPGPTQARSQSNPADSGSLAYRGSPTLWAREVPAGELARKPALIVARGADTVRLAVNTVDAADPEPPVWAILGADTSAAVSDTDRVVIARPLPQSITYKWFFLPGTVVEMTGASGPWVRVRLDRELQAWVAGSAVRVPMAGLPPPVRLASNVRVQPDSHFVDVVIPVGDRPPYFVEQTPDALELTLYGTVANTDIIRFVANDPLVRDISWEQVTSDRARYTIRLSRAPYGYLVLWRAGSLVLRVRRPPAVDRSAPLRGLTIVVDPGHPPGGATGPSGLPENEATLAVGLRLRQVLEARGARVVMTRATPEAVALGDRPIFARRANGHAFVSIHLDALPDGVNPFPAHGTAAYFFHGLSEPLARHLQRGMVRRMGLRNNGVLRNNLAVVRQTWMPSVLCEGAFLMVPEHEAALRTPEFQDRYARGIADGLEAYFREMGEGR